MTRKTAMIWHIIFLSINIATLYYFRPIPFIHWFIVGVCGASIGFLCLYLVDIWNEMILHGRNKFILWWVLRKFK